MSEQITEMDDSYANGGYVSMSEPEVALAAATVPSVPQPELTVSDPTPPRDLVGVYAEKISSVSFRDDTDIAEFDIVFQVNCSCPETGSTRIYNVVKRIGVDRYKLADQAKAGAPISIVEAQKTITESFGDRWLEIAGLK